MARAWMKKYRVDRLPMGLSSGLESQWFNRWRIAQ